MTALELITSDGGNAMNEFIRLVVNELQHAVVQLLSALVFAGAIVAYIYLKCYRGRKPFPWKTLLQWGVLVSYLFVVGYAIWGRLGGIGASGVSFHLFRALREAWNHFSVTAWLNIFLNIALLIPFGILVPITIPKMRKWWKMLLGGILFSLYLETMQFLSGRGIFDIDDLLSNTLGVVVGFALYSVPDLIWKRPRYWGGRLVGSCLVLLLPIAFFGAIFAKYERQPFGNLPISPTFQADTSKIQWKLHCELSDQRKRVPIYQLSKPTLSDCMAFASELENGLGLAFDPARTQIYDESILFWDGPHSLTIQRADGSYKYHMVDDDLLGDPAEAERIVLEELLERFDIQVPQLADFTYTNSGFHRFTADELIMGDGMVDGTISCQYRDSKEISELKYQMHRYDYITDLEIISAMEAFTKFQNGMFLEIPGVWKSGDCGLVSVLDCNLTYEIDTKGFRMPVYVFSIAYGENSVPGKVMISAA